MDKIDLDAIITNVKRISFDNGNASTDTQVRIMMKEAIRQALVLASEKATIYTETFSSPHTHEWEKRIDKQSILDVNDLVV